VKPGDRSTGSGRQPRQYGNTDAPHLHFHVMSTPDPFDGQRIRSSSKSFKLDGRLARWTDRRLMTGKPAQQRVTARDEEKCQPLVLDVMTYAAG